MKIERAPTIVTMSMDEVVERVRQSLMVEDNLQDTEALKLVISDAEATEDLSNCVESNYRKGFLVERGFEDVLGFAPRCRHAFCDTADPGEFDIYTKNFRRLVTDATELEAQRYVALGVLPE